MQRSKQLLGLVVTTLLLVSSASLGGAVLTESPTAANASETGDTWQSDRADDGRTGATSASGPNAEDVKTDWHAEMTDGQPTGVSVADGTAYVGVEKEYDLGISKGAVVAKDATTGDVQWKRTGIPKVAGTPTVSGDTVYVGTEAYLYDYRRNESIERGFYALDAETGETKWKFTGAVKWEGDASPIVVGETVYAIANNTVYALDADTGEKLRTVSLAQGDRQHVSQIAVVDGTLYVRVDDSEVVNRDTYEVEYDTYVVAFDADTGERRWNATFDGQSPGFAATADALYVSLQPDTVAKLSTDGDRRWKREVAADFGNSSPDWVSAPAVDDDTMYVTSNDENEDGDTKVSAVHALDTTSGTEDWQFQTEQLLNAAPSVGAESVYVAGDSTDSDFPTAAYSLDESDGAEQWSHALEEGAAIYPFAIAVTNEQVFIATADKTPTLSTGDVYAMGGNDTKSGEEGRTGDDDEPTEEDEQPRVEIETTPKNGEEKQLDGNSTVALSANVTNDETIATYEWDVDGDGDYEVTGKTAEATVPACGEVEVSVRVTDDDGDTTTKRITLSGGE